MRKIQILLLPAVLALAYGGFWFFFPLKASELSNRYELWRAGVKTVESAGLHGYVRDTCQGSNAAKATAKPGRKDQGKEPGCSCVVMIHGLADSAMTWKRILLWPESGWLEPVRLFAFDLPGAGRSPAPQDPSGYRVRKMAARLQEAMAPLCPRWVVVGNSLGGWVAAWLALDWSQGVSRLLLLDSSGLRAERKPRELVKFFAEPTVESMKEFQKRAYHKGRELPDSVWRAVAERMKASNARAVLEAQTPEDDLDARLPTLRRPTLVLWGAEDRITPPASGMHLRSLIPGAIWRQIPECGHLPQKECPLEVIKAIYNMVNFGAV